MTTELDLDDYDDEDPHDAAYALYDIEPKKCTRSKAQREKTRQKLSEHQDSIKLEKDLDWFSDIE